MILFQAIQLKRWKISCLSKELRKEQSLEWLGGRIRWFSMLKDLVSITLNRIGFIRRLEGKRGGEIIKRKMILGTESFLRTNTS